MNSPKKMFHLFLAMFFAVVFLACNVESDLGMRHGKSAAPSTHSSYSVPQSNPDNPPRNNQTGSPVTSPTTTLQETDTSTSLVSGKVLRWSAPRTYTNGATLNPKTDLQGYEIFVKENNGTFTASDVPAALVSATDKNGNLIQSFNLMSLNENIFSANRTYFFCIRSIAVSGEVSVLSSAVTLKI